MNVYLLVELEYDYEEIWEYYKFYGVFSSRAKANKQAKELKLSEFLIISKKLDENM